METLSDVPEKDEDYREETGLPNELPLGILHKGDTVKNFDLAYFDGRAADILHDQELRADSPFTWMAKVCSVALNSLGDNHTPKKNFWLNDESIPGVISDLTLKDANYILLKAHVYNYDDKIEDMETQCGCRRRKLLSFREFPLDDIKIEFSEDPERFYEYPVDLVKGYTKTTGDDQYTDTTFKRFYVSVPTLGDAMRQERFYQMGPNNKNFQDRLMLSCIQSIESDNGDRMPRETLLNIGPTIIQNLIEKDRVEISRAINKYPPSVNLTKKVDCPRCSKEIRIGVDTSFFFPEV